MFGYNLIDVIRATLEFCVSLSRPDPPISETVMLKKSMEAVAPPYLPQIVRLDDASK